MKRGAERVDKERKSKRKRGRHLDEEKQTMGTKVRCTRDQNRDTKLSDNNADRE